MTRDEYNSVSNSIDALKDELALPFRFTNMTQNIMLLGADSANSTQESLARDEAAAARRLTSPLMIPEKTLGVITDNAV